MKQFENRWIFEEFEGRPGALIKPMFGGLALYVDGQLKLALMEDPGEKSFRGKRYPFDIWNGVLVATSREHHPTLKSKVSTLVEHPVLGKWLYLPFDSEDWEGRLNAVLRLVRTNDPLIGVWPGEKRTRKSSRSKRPVRVARGMGLGPTTEKDLNAAGIMTLQALKKMGWQKALQKVVRLRPDRANVNMAYGLIAACTDTDWRELSPTMRSRAKRFVAGLRVKRKGR